MAVGDDAARTFRPVERWETNPLKETDEMPKSR